MASLMALHSCFSHVACHGGYLETASLAIQDGHAVSEASVPLRSSKKFHIDSFRPGQLETITAVMKSSSHIMSVMATGLVKVR